MFNSTETAESLRKNGAVVPGYRPGEMTAKHFDYLLGRLTVVGAGYLLFVCLLPELLVAKYSVPFLLWRNKLIDRCYSYN